MDYQQEVENKYFWKESDNFSLTDLLNGNDLSTEFYHVPMNPVDPPNDLQPQVNVTRLEKKRSTVDDSDAYEQEILNPLRENLGYCIGLGYIHLAEEFKNFPKNIEMHDFIQAMRNINALSENEAEEIFCHFAENGGCVNTQKFIKKLMGKMNYDRKILIVGVYAILRDKAQGVLTIRDIEEFFTARNHPDFRSGAKPEFFIKAEFFGILKCHHQIVRKNIMDDDISEQQFLQFYSYIAATIIDDKEFYRMIKYSFNLTDKNIQYSINGR
jgi:hypothetical protein